MSRNPTERSKAQVGLFAVQALTLLLAAASLLGAHNRTRNLAAAPAGPPQTPASLLAGHGTAAARGWSPALSFRLVDPRGWGRMAALDSAALLTVLKLNRVDFRHAQRTALVVPDSIADELDYAPFPASVPALAGVPKFLAVSRRVQALAAYEDGRLVRWGPVSTGRAETPTDAGLFFTNWKSRRTISTENPSWILDWYVNIIALKGVAFHEYELPGRPASHGCIRLLEADARWLYTWADQWVPGRGSEVKRWGTPVLVFGEFDYTGRAPWLDLPADPAAHRVTPAELEQALRPHLATLYQRSYSPLGRWLAQSSVVPSGF
jgi:hypothetical protein